MEDLSERENMYRRNNNLPNESGGRCFPVEATAPAKSLRSQRAQPCREDLVMQRWCWEEVNPCRWKEKRPGKSRGKGLWGWWAVGLSAASGMEQKEVWEVRPERR